MEPTSRYEPSSLDSYELVQQVQHDEFSLRSSGDDDFVKPIIRLPAKALPVRRNFLAFGTAATIATASLIFFSIILHSIHGWKPYRGPYALSFEDMFSTSCDLVASNSSFVENVFTIDLRSPKQFSFGAAKGIDVLWDFCVGQGGRVLLAWISYKVFMDGLARLMEDSPVSYQLYATMVFETTSLRTTWHCARAVFTGHGWRGKAFLAWFTVATVYVLAFSTLISAATGYVGSSTAGYKMPDKNLVTAESQEISICFDLTRASNAQGLMVSPITGPKSPVIGPSIPWYDSAFHRIGQDLKYQTFMTLYNSSLGSIGCYYPDYTFPSNSSNNAIYQNPHNWRKEEEEEEEANRKGLQRLFSNSSVCWNPTHCYKNMTLPEDLKTIAQCLPQSHFVWGFSSLLLYVVCSLQIVWIFGMSIVWVDANICSQLCRRGRKTQGYFRAALDIAEAMRNVLGDESCAYTNAEINHELKRFKSGIQYYTTDTTSDGISHIGLGSKSGKFSLGNAPFYGRSRINQIKGQD